MTDMDDLLDQLEEEVKRERRLKNAERNREEVTLQTERTIEGLLIPKTGDMSNANSGYESPEDPVEFLNDQNTTSDAQTLDVVPDSREIEESTDKNGEEEESRVLELILQTEEEEDISEPAPIKGVSIDVSLSFNKDGAESKLASTTLNENDHLIATVSVEEDQLDPSNSLSSDDSIDQEEHTTSPLSSEEYSPQTPDLEVQQINDGIQEAIQSISQEDGLDFETIQQQQGHELANQAPLVIEEVEKIKTYADTFDSNIDEGTQGTVTAASAVIDEIIGLIKSTEMASIEFIQESIPKETVNLSVSAPDVVIKRKATQEEPTVEMENETTATTSQVLEPEEDPPSRRTQRLTGEVSDAAFEMAKTLLEEIKDIEGIMVAAKAVDVSKEEVKPGSSKVETGCHQPDDSSVPEAPVKEERKSVISSTHAVGNNVGNDLRLTESELQLGKSKPIWIRDEECKKCMLCQSKFTLVNRRHHCRCCGRVLCSECCSIRRFLPYMQQDEKKQRVCSPCNGTLDRIELYEKAVESSVADQPSSSLNDPTSATGPLFARKKSVLKNRTKSENETAQTEQSPHTEQATSSDIRRSVKFLDGVKPGDEQLSSTSQQTEDRRQPGTLSSRSNRPNRSSRRTREIVAKEENQRLNAKWFYGCSPDWNTSGAINPWRSSELFKRLENNSPVRLILKRNIHVMLQFIEYQGKKVFNLYTIGFNTLGVDELLLVFEKRPDEKDTYLPSNLIRSIMRYSEICLDPTTDLLDDRNGIRQCKDIVKSLAEL